MTYSLYANGSCTGTASATQTVSVSSAAIPSPPDSVLPTPGTYAYQAAYSGDRAYQPALSTGEPLTVPAAPGRSNRFDVVFARAQPNGIVHVKLKLPGRGRLRVVVSAGHSTIALHTAVVKRTGTESLTIRPSRNGRRVIARLGRPAVFRVEITYTPNGGKPRTKHVQAKLDHRAGDRPAAFSTSATPNPDVTVQPPRTYGAMLSRAELRSAAGPAHASAQPRVLPLIRV